MLYLLCHICKMGGMCLLLRWNSWGLSALLNGTSTIGVARIRLTEPKNWKLVNTTFSTNLTLLRNSPCSLYKGHLPECLHIICMQMCSKQLKLTDSQSGFRTIFILLKSIKLKMHKLSAATDPPDAFSSKLLKIGFMWTVAASFAYESPWKCWLCVNVNEQCLYVPLVT